MESEANIATGVNVPKLNIITFITEDLLSDCWIDF